MVDIIEREIKELDAKKEALVAQLNAVIGAKQELEHILEELKNAKNND